MDHAWEALLRDLNGKGFNLRSPHRRNAAANGSQRKTTDAVKQASHSEPAHFDTACTIVRVVFTAACAVYTALIMLALVVVSRPNAPAMRGISPAESIKPRPNSAWSLNTMSPAMRIVAYKNAVRHNPMICLHHWMKPSV